MMKEPDHKIPKLTKAQLQAQRVAVRLPLNVAGQNRKPPGKR